MKRFLVGLLAWLAWLPLWAQAEAGTVEIFAGADLNYRNIYYNNRLYDLLIYLTPAVKWHPGNHWTVAAQALVPVMNDYGDYYRRVRLNLASVSKEVYFGRQGVKVSAGLFTKERYGVDVKWFCPVTDWLALNAQVGYTGYCSMANGWTCSQMDMLTAQAGARVYLTRTNTEFRLTGGRYVYEDWGVTGECMRHFRHCTVGVYAQYSDWGKENGGFKVVMMLPPYRRSHAKVRLRTASNFRLTYNIQADPYAHYLYRTDPEENEREGDFDRSAMPWGSNRMAPDFTTKGGGR
jgi:hypothetical protein